MDDIVSSHINNKYYISVNKQNQGCLVNFPANYLLDIPIVSKTMTYSLKEDHISYNINNGISQDFTSIKYVQRFTVLTDILLKALQLNIPNKLIIISDGKTQLNSLMQILPAPTSPKDIEKEKLIANIYADIMLGLFDYISADKLEVSNGYDVLCNLIEMGGL